MLQYSCKNQLAGRCLLKSEEKIAFRIADINVRSG